MLFGFCGCESRVINPQIISKKATTSVRKLAAHKDNAYSLTAQCLCAQTVQSIILYSNNI